MQIIYCITPPKLLNCMRIISQSVINHTLKNDFFGKKIIKKESKKRQRKKVLTVDDVFNLRGYNQCAVHWLICNFTLLKN